MIRALGLAMYGPMAASHRVRLAQYREGLIELGIDLQIQSLLGDDYLKARFQGKPVPVSLILKAFFERVKLLLTNDNFELIIIHCELLPIVPAWLERLLLRVPYIYDIDDAWYLRYHLGRLSKFRYILGHKFEAIIKNASAITAGSSNLAEYSERFNKRVAILPSVVDTKVYRPLKTFKESTFTIGWIGSPTTSKYLGVLVEPLLIFGASRKVRLVIVGGKMPNIVGIDIREIPWSEHTETELINTFDVGVMPLIDDEWARGKCAYKLVQYMACGVPVVASRVGANIDLVTEECGFLVSNSGQWVDSFTQLYDRPLLRQQMGACSRRRVVDHYSLERTTPLLHDVIRNVLETKKG